MKKANQCYIYKTTYTAEANKRKEENILKYWFTEKSEGLDLYMYEDQN